jgi:iron complex transport system substrate-binding protein
MKTMKKALSLLVIAAMLTASLTACGSTESSTSDDEQVTSAAAESESSEDEAETEGDTEAAEEADTASDESSASGIVETLYDPNFTIEIVSDGIKKVTDGDGRELILVSKTIDEVPEEYSDSIVVRTPVENAVFLSSTQACTFRTVDDEAVVSGIGGVTGSAYEWSDIPAVAAGLDDGSIISVGDGYSDPDYEQIQALNPDVVFVYGGEFGQADYMAKFDELGINYAVDNEYLESSYLARMEWMRFILTFFEADDAADAAFESVKANIDSTKEAIEGLDNPTVAIFSLYDGAVYATSDTSWLGNMISDMGGVNAFSGLDTSSLTYESAFETISTADVIIYSSTPSYLDGMAGLEDAFPQITECAAYESGRVYQYGEGFWYGIDQSDIMACDLAAVLYPDTFDGRELSYFVQLEK